MFRKVDGLVPPSWSPLPRTIAGPTSPSTHPPNAPSYLGSISQASLPKNLEHQFSGESQQSKKRTQLSSTNVAGFCRGTRDDGMHRHVFLSFLVECGRNPSAVCLKLVSSLIDLGCPRTLTPSHPYTHTPLHPHTLTPLHPHRYPLTPSHPFTLAPVHPRTLTPSHPHRSSQRFRTGCRGVA